MVLARDGVTQAERDLNRRDFFKLAATFMAATYLPKEFLMPTYNYSGDFYIKLLKDLYRKNGVTIPEADFSTLQRLVDEERTRDEAVGSWQRVKDNKIGAGHLDLPFTPIYSQVLAEDVASLTISIPGTYTHLMIMGQGRINGSGGQNAVSIVVRYNSDTGANYTWGSEGQFNGAHIVNQGTGSTYGSLGALVADGQASGYAGMLFSVIPHYTSSFYKSSFSLAAYTLGTPASFNVDRQATWLNTNKIETMTLFPDPAFASAKLESGSVISIYGIQ